MCVYVLFCLAPPAERLKVGVKKYRKGKPSVMDNYVATTARIGEYFAIAKSADSN